MHGGEPLWFCPSIKPLSQVLRLGGRERREQSREVKDRERSIADGVKKKKKTAATTGLLRLFHCSRRRGFEGRGREQNGGECVCASRSREIRISERARNSS
jgi:hypothetical protein